MMSPTGRASWFHSTFAISNFFPDRTQQLQASTREVPVCDYCLRKVSEPVVTKCGHIFDRHCIKERLRYGLRCAKDGLEFKEEECSERPDLYQTTKCSILARVFSLSHCTELKFDASIFLTREKLLQNILAEYLKTISTRAEACTISDSLIHFTLPNSNIPAGFKFMPAKTLADYHVLPGEEASVAVFLA